MDLNGDPETKARLFDELTRANPDVVWVLSADLEAVEFVSSGYEELWGQSAERLADDPLAFVEAVHPDHRGRLRAGMARLVDGEPIQVELRIDERDGYERWVKITGRPVYDDAGELTRLAGFTQDITERKTHERRLETLHTATQQLVQAESMAAAGEAAVTITRRVLDRPITAIWRYDAETDTLVPLAATNSASAFSNASDDQPLGLGPIQSGTDEMAVFERGETVVFEDYQCLANPSHPETPLGTLLVAPLDEFGIFCVGSDTVEPFDSSTRTLVEILAQDLTVNLERIARTQEIERQNERLERFTSVVSHDLRNPLNVAQARLNHARDCRDSPNLEQASSALERMETLIGDTLALARAGEAIDDREETTLDAVASEAWEHVSTDEAELDVERNVTVHADRSRLLEVFENLFRNAVVHGGTAVTVRVGTLAGGAGFYVADDGHGIDPETRESIFEPGYTTSDSGTGFGLRIVRDIAEAHGWTVEATTGDRGGARFEFRDVSV